MLVIIYVYLHVPPTCVTTQTYLKLIIVVVYELQI